MELLLIFFAAIVVSHFIADFVFQFDWMAQGKSKELFPLIVHGVVYTVVFAVCISACIAIFGVHTILSPQGWAAWVIVNGVLHTCTDFVTSRASANEFQKNNVHNAFVVIGADQMIHMLTFLLTAYWMVL